MSQPVTFELFLTKDPLTTYSDPAKFAAYEPKIAAYRQRLADAVTASGMATELPKLVEELAKDQFNLVEWLYTAGPLSKDELRITDTPGSELVAQMAAGKLTAEEVFKAFAHRGVVCHQFTNAAMDLFVDEGLKRARWLDAEFQRTGKIVGPLHGLPISLKEQMNYGGRVTHGLYVKNIENVPTEHGVTTQLLENLGAVFYIRTNQPQTLMHLCLNNNITGISRNPFNLSLTPGGSLSGEGSICGFGALVIGVGSDIGGLIRGPAAFSGCHGLRPTTRRILTLGGISLNAGQELVPAVGGPLSRSMDDIELFMRVLINEGHSDERDNWTLPMPWRQVAAPAPDQLTVAVMYDDGIVKPTPPIQRGLQHTVDKLKAAGVKVVTFEPLDTQVAYETVTIMYTCDGNWMNRQLLGELGEPLCKLTKWSLNYGKGDTEYPAHEVRQLNFTRDGLRNKYNSWLVDNKVDFIIAPVYHNVAPKPETAYNWSYTTLFNILDMPSLTFQTGLFSNPEVDQWGSDHADYHYRSPMEQLELEQYDPKEFDHAPIALQIAGRRYFDEEVVAAGKTIVKILGVDLYKRE